MGPNNKEIALDKFQIQPIRIEGNHLKLVKVICKNLQPTLFLKQHTEMFHFEIKKEKDAYTQLFSALASQCCQGRKASESYMDWE